MSTVAAFLDFLAWHPPYGDDKYIAIVKAHRLGGFKGFFDESGIHDGASVCVVAGYVGSLNEWRRFDETWGEYANTPGFHAKEFFARDTAGNRVGPYRGWHDSRAEEYLSTLLTAITSLKLNPVGALVDVIGFHQYTEDERRLLTAGQVTHRGKWIQTGAPTKPYFIAFWKVVTSAVEVSDRADWKVEFVFDLQDQYESLALKTYARLKSELGEPYCGRLGPASFESRHAALGLQAADLLAYCWHQFGTHGHHARPEVHQVLSSQRTDTLVAFTADMMDKLLGRAPETPGTIYGYDGATHSFRPDGQNPS